MQTSLGSAVKENNMSAVGHRPMLVLFLSFHQATVAVSESEWTNNGRDEVGYTPALCSLTYLQSHAARPKHGAPTQPMSEQQKL